MAEVNEKGSLKNKIDIWRKERFSAQRRWSAIHHAVLFGSILCSITAGALIQFEAKSAAATILTSMAAALTGMASSGGFERKWRSNRLSRSKGDQLLLDLERKNADLDKIIEQFKSAIGKHDLEVVGDKNDTDTAGQKEKPEAKL